MISLRQLLGRCVNVCHFTEATGSKGFSFQTGDCLGCFIMSMSLVGIMTTNSKLKDCALRKWIGDITLEAAVHKNLWAAQLHICDGYM